MVSCLEQSVDAMPGSGSNTAVRKPGAAVAVEGPVRLSAKPSLPELGGEVA